MEAGKTDLTISYSGISDSQKNEKEEIALNVAQPDNGRIKSVKNNGISLSQPEVFECKYSESPLSARSAENAAVASKKATKKGGANKKASSNGTGYLGNSQLIQKNTDKINSVIDSLEKQNDKPKRSQQSDSGTSKTKNTKPKRKQQKPANQKFSKKPVSKSASKTSSDESDIYSDYDGSSDSDVAEETTRVSKKGVKKSKKISKKTHKYSSASSLSEDDWSGDESRYDVPKRRQSQSENRKRPEKIGMPNIKKPEQRMDMVTKAFHEYLQNPHSITYINLLGSMCGMFANQKNVNRFDGNGI